MYTVRITLVTYNSVTSPCRALHVQYMQKSEAIRHQVIFFYFMGFQFFICYVKNVTLFYCKKPGFQKMSMSCWTIYQETSTCMLKEFMPWIPLQKCILHIHVVVSLNIASLCTVTTYEDCCIMGICITSGAKAFHILNVYIPYGDGSNHDELLFYLGTIDSIVKVTSTPYICVCCGSFNDNIRIDVSKFGRVLLQFC